jgi:hypothetical protein
VQTYYLAELQQVAGDFFIAYSKVFDGSPLIPIGDPIAVSFTVPEIFRFEVKPLAMTNELRAYIGTTLQEVAEDNDIHGNLRVGIRGEANNVGFSMIVDGFRAARLPDIVKESTISVEAEAAGTITGQRSGWFQAVVVTTGAKGVMGATAVVIGGAAHNHQATTARFGTALVLANALISAPNGDAQMFAVGTRSGKHAFTTVSISAESSTNTIGAPIVTVVEAEAVVATTGFKNASVAIFIETRKVF